MGGAVMVQTPIKSQVSERLEVTHWLKTNGYPALPVAPAQDHRKYPTLVKEKSSEDVWSH